MGAPVDESPAASAAPSSATDRPWREAGKRFRYFLRRVPPTGLIAVLAGSQPDGLVAGALLWQALRRSGRAALL